MIKRILSLLLCVIILLCVLPGSLADNAVSPAPTVRVLLKRPGLRDGVTLLLGCTYTVKADSGSEMVLPAGTEISLQCIDDQMYLHYERMNLCAGKEVQLIRSALEADTHVPADRGLQFTPGGAVYPGDLRVTGVNGFLQAVLTVSVEDYLLGVVPYEMNDNYPLEALKAQAVCARTYALSHVDATRNYDVMDTTDSQVFAGVTPFQTNSARAVQETAGIVGTWQGNLASCYYSASNGGQTELPQNQWGPSESDGCYDMREDPYDLENPDSVVHTVKVNKDGRNLPEALLTALEETKIREIKTMVTAGQQGESYFAPELVITYTDEAGAEKTKTLTPLTNGLADALSLSIESTEREMITVREEGATFVIETRRFGHGVGLSQRGAQQMASAYGKTYKEILSFYYPGMELMLAPAGAVALPTVPAALAATPGPTATPTPRPTLMPVTTPEKPEEGWLASVEGIDDDSSLNLRDRPASDGTILMRLYKHQQLWVLEQVNDSWVHVKTDSVEGYVMVKFLERK